MKATLKFGGMESGRSAPRLVGLGVGVGSGVGVGVGGGGVAVGSGVGVAVGSGVGVAVGSGVGANVTVGVGVSGTVTVGIEVDDGFAAGCGVKVGAAWVGMAGAGATVFVALSTALGGSSAQANAMAITKTENPITDKCRRRMNHLCHLCWRNSLAAAVAHHLAAPDGLP